MKTLNGKIVLITGSTRGIGEAIAYEFVKQGAVVLLHGVKTSDASKDALHAIQKVSKKSKIYFANIAKFQEVFEMFEKIKIDFKHIDILVNNAGIERSNTFLQMSNKEWEDVMRVNVNGTFYVTKICLPLLLKTKNAKIINISSIYGLTGDYGLTNYAASKAAIIGFTKSLAKELAKHAITVNAVCPGIIDTGMMHAIPKKQLEKKFQQIPLRRLGKKEEIAKLVTFLSSDDANYITGQAININGGMY